MNERVSAMSTGLFTFKDLVQRGKALIDAAAHEYTLKEEFTTDGVDPSVIPFSDASSHIAEQYKMLCTKIFLSDENKQRPKSLAVMSAQPSDGKTTTAVNIAATLATSFKQKVILIDSDLRRPRMHSFFDIPRSPGLKEVLEGVQDYRKFTEEPAVRNLHVIPAGNPCESPAVLLNSAGMKVLLSRLAGKFDVILFDTPPIMRAADAQALGALCDYRLFVVKQGVTPKHMIEEALSTLAGTGASPDSCVVTNVQRALDYYSYWTNRSYREYYQETKPY